MSAVVAEPLSAEDLVDAYAPSEPWGTFTVYLPKGEPIECGYPERYGNVRDFEAGLKRFWKKWSEVAEDEAMPEPIRALAPKSFEEAYAAYLLVFYAVAPTFSEENALRLLKAPWTMDRLRKQITEAQRFVSAAVALDEIEKAGNALPETPSPEDASGRV